MIDTRRHDRDLVHITTMVALGVISGLVAVVLYALNLWELLARYVNNTPVSTPLSFQYWVRIVIASFCAFMWAWPIRWRRSAIAWLLRVGAPLILIAACVGMRLVGLIVDAYQPSA